jgi:hypothetical protein
VLLASSTPSVLALKKETDSIPIVMMDVGNPFLPGLIQSLAHPGGNVTGYSNDAWRLVHQSKPIGYRANPGGLLLSLAAQPVEPGAQRTSRTHHYSERTLQDWV